ncbi:MAG: pilus assembly protein PilM [Sedimentisphaerales bacterium]|nr:pilus assembly protein PilM [Sedimentisphaerales bacterium]
MKFDMKKQFLTAEMRKKLFGIDVRTKVFGIDICNDKACFVELRKHGRQIKVARCGTIPLDKGVVKNGVVKDPAALTRILKQFKIAGTFRTANAALSVCSEPVLLQILDMQDAPPGETRRFIQNEVKQYAILPLKNVETDYCGLKSSDVHTRRVLVGATQSENLSTTVAAIEKDNINVVAVEPAVISFIRICYDMIIRPQREQNIIFLLLRDNTLNLCLFERQGLDFLRVKKFDTEIVNSQQRGDWLSQEVESVIQFHELERGSSAESWQIFVACCPENKYSVEIVDEIKNKISRHDVEIAAFENSLMDIAIDPEDKREIPPVAAGVAMRLLDEDKTSIKLNMLPKDIVSTKKAKKQLLVIINTAAVIFLIMLMHIMFLVNTSRTITLELQQRNQFRQNIDLDALAEQQVLLNQGLQKTIASVNTIKSVFKDKIWYDWASIMTELGRYTPRAVQIQRLRTEGLAKMNIQGLAVGHDAINDFVDQLALCEAVESVKLLDTRQNTKYGYGLINYSISCSLATGKDEEKEKD